MLEKQAGVCLILTRRNMRIPCPVCATVIMAGKEHVGMKNRCVTCRTKFLIPSREDGEAQILERGVAPQSSVPTLQVRPPGTASPIEPGKHRLLINPGSEEKARPHKLLTSSDPLRAPPNAPGGKTFRALPSVPPPHPSGTEPPPKVHVRKKLVRRKIAKKKAVRKHSLEHLPALAPDPGPPEQDNPGESPASTGTQSAPPETGALPDNSRS